MKIGVFFVGELHDDGFNASALAGARAAADRGLAEIAIVDGVPYDQDVIRPRLEALAAAQDGVIFVGGQGDVATPEVAAAFPDRRFAIVQGARSGPNLASYVVRQEDSAFLAGCLAAMLTETGMLAHLSGHRVRPGLMGRAAFVAGVKHQDPAVRVLTGFCGTQDDNAVTRDWAAAQIAEGADILFTMLNGARQGAVDACRAAGPRVRQIGNALDWTARDPAVFVASAIARIDLGVLGAITDMTAGRTPPDSVEFGLADGQEGGDAIVSLALAPDVPPDCAARIDAIAAAIRSGAVRVPEAPEDFDGPEFALDGAVAPRAGS